MVMVTGQEVYSHELEYFCRLFGFDLKKDLPIEQIKKEIVFMHGILSRNSFYHDILAKEGCFDIEDVEKVKKLIAKAEKYFDKTSGGSGLLNWQEDKHEIIFQAIPRMTKNQARHLFWYPKWTDEEKLKKALYPDWRPYVPKFVPILKFIAFVRFIYPKWFKLIKECRKICKEHQTSREKGGRSVLPWYWNWKDKVTDKEHAAIIHESIHCILDNNNIGRSDSSDAFREGVDVFFHRKSGLYMGYYNKHFFSKGGIKEYWRWSEVLWKEFEDITDKREFKTIPAILLNQDHEITLRVVRNLTHGDKLERAMCEFCQTYGIHFYKNYSTVLSIKQLNIYTGFFSDIIALKAKEHEDKSENIFSSKWASFKIRKYVNTATSGVGVIRQHQLDRIHEFFRCVEKEDFDPDKDFVKLADKKETYAPLVYYSKAKPHYYKQLKHVVHLIEHHHLVDTLPRIDLSRSLIHPWKGDRFQVMIHETIHYILAQMGIEFLTKGVSPLDEGICVFLHLHFKYNKFYRNAKDPQYNYWASFFDYICIKKGVMDKDGVIIDHRKVIPAIMEYAWDDNDLLNTMKKKLGNKFITKKRYEGVNDYFKDPKPKISLPRHEVRDKNGYILKYK